ncbi:MAG: AzlC family ABC transporter permease [Roseicyclus sp.]
MPPTPSARDAYLAGLRDALPFVIVVIPFGMLFGVVGSEAGLNLAQVMGFSVVVIAGASQFAALQLMTENAPAFIVIASALAVNLRMAMYSAALAPHLGPAPLWQRALIAYMNVDQTYALAVQRYEAAPAASVPAKVAFFFGTATPVVPLWVAATLLGALVGAAVPADWGLDFVVPVTFLALVAPALRTLAHLGAALASVTVMLLAAGLPWNLGLLVAGVSGMAVGAEIERRMTLRAARQAGT